MVSKYLRKGPNKLKKCSERRTNSCSDETDGCCGVIACKYCLELETYDGIERGIAEFAGTAWTGTVGGLEFVAYWERGYVSGECEFVVTLDGEEVYRKSCYEGQSCRDSSDSAEVTIDYEAGTLRWDKYEPRPLPVVVDPETNCRTHFCGDCHCTCKCLCVTVTEPDGITIHKGEICDITYSDCGAPEWSGTVGGIAISLTLDRDQETGACILGGMIDYQEVDWVFVSGCQDLTASFVLNDYTTIDVTCKECGCEVLCQPCPDPTEYPTLTVSVYPIRYCANAPVDIVVTFDNTAQSWIGSGPWVGLGDTLNVRLSCVGNSFMASIQSTLMGSPTSCTFGATSPTNQDCELLLYDWVLLGSVGGQFCCGGGLLGSDIGLTVML